MSFMTLGLLAALGLTAPEPQSSGAAHAEKPTVECHDDTGRQLRGHTFLYPILQSSAFVTTHAGLREGLARSDVPDLPVGRFGTVDVLLTGVQQTLDLGLGLTPWLGLEAFARATIVTGANTRSLVVEGASVDLLGEVGPVLRVWRNEHSGTQVSVRANFGYEKGRDILVLPLVGGIVNTPGATLEDVVFGNLGEYINIPTSEITLNGGGYLAQALGRTFSIQASARAGYAWKERKPFDALANGHITQKSHAVRVNLAAAFTVDFAHHGVPVALMGEYLFSTGRETEVDLPDQTPASSTLALGVYYSGRPNFQTGLGAVTTLNALPHRGLGPEGQTLESGEPTLSYGQFILRYIW
ncbi:hypothetical protein LY474_17770 [Myxococcus stipitatus]|uniref:hypothetical protein n=1 Tax=Myxococcus stipitatus TaxID=83455 RepID=UPI001F30BAD8|nr:hypothetical protein [Myxococcus stipitatus]MCE9669646.1 hypothetical protein [Myxococcus stipitatus]